MTTILNPTPTPVQLPAPKFRRAGWRAVAATRWIRLDSQLREAEEAATPVEPACTEARRLIDAAAQAFTFRSLGSWVTGSVEEHIATSLDCAEELLFETAGSAEERVRHGRSLRDRINQRFSARDRRRAEALACLGDAAKTPSAEGLRGAAQILSRGTLDLRCTQRSRRNATLLAAAMVAAATVLLVFGVDHWRFLSFARFGHRPHTGAVATLGAMGGLLSVAALLLRSDRVTRASGGFLVQAAFKVSLGAFIAPIALLLTQRGVLGITTPQGARSLTVWALIIGYSQDIVTRKLDERLNASQPPATGTPAAGTPTTGAADGATQD